MVSPYMFNSIDFFEADLICEPQLINNEIVIEFGGVSFMGKDSLHIRLNDFNVLLDNYNNMYLSGICRFKFKNIIEFIKERHDKGGFIDGVSIKLTENEEKKSYAVYVFPPTGIKDESQWFEITVKTLSPVEVSFDENNIVDLTEYCKNPQKFEWSHNINRN